MTTFDTIECVDFTISVKTRNGKYAKGRMTKSRDDSVEIIR